MYIKYKRLVKEQNKNITQCIQIRAKDRKQIKKQCLTAITTDYENKMSESNVIVSRSLLVGTQRLN